MPKNNLCQEENNKGIPSKKIGLQKQAKTLGSVYVRTQINNQMHLMEA